MDEQCPAVTLTRINAGAGVSNKSACATSLQTPCRSAYGGRAIKIPNTLKAFTFKIPTPAAE